VPNRIGTPPQKWVIPVTKGCDRRFTVRRRDSEGDLTNWSADVVMVIDVDADTTVEVDAVVNGANAEVVLESATCDQVDASSRWRLLMADDGVETALAVGTFSRHDG